MGAAGGVGGGEVEVQQPGGGGGAFRVGLVGVGALPGVEVHQVVQGVADGQDGGGFGGLPGFLGHGGVQEHGGLLEEVGGEQRVQRRLHGGHRTPRQGGHRRGGRLGARVQSEQPEDPGGGRVECVVRGAERGRDGGGFVVGEGQAGQPPLLAGQLRDQPVDGAPEMGEEPRGGDPQREGQPVAEPGQDADGLVLAAGAVGADGTAQQVRGVVLAEHVERELPGVVDGGEPVQPAAAGDQG
ncbi:hypothetical protein OG946_20080 [Streptomyces sp. NBC_01808]|nr:hypothetical protein [Streptomyces sp. NBC_01808]WSA39454.1 hypothetical protein OG946_20080 [Streptomyces sp. NBC_01808]